MASTVCGPLWLAATQADVASVVAGAMSVYVTDASVALFLPHMRAAEEAELARRAAALTVDDGVAVVTLDVDLDDDGELAVVAKVTAAPAPGFSVARTLARRARGGFESARGASEAAMDAAREAARGASEAAMDAAREAARGASEAAMDAARGATAAATTATAAATTAASAANVAANTTARWLSVAWSDGARAVERGADLVAASLPAAFLRNDAAGARFGERPGADEERRVGAETPLANGSGETLVDSEAYEPVDLDEVDPDVVSAVTEDPETRRVLSQPSALVRLMSDAAVVAALRDPETSRACADFVKDPSTFAERRKDPKFAAVARRAMAVAGAAGGAAGVALMRKHGLLRRKTRDEGATEKVHTQEAEAEAEAEKRDASEEARESGSNTSSAQETSETNSNQSATSASSAYAWTGGVGVPSLADLGGLFGASSFSASSAPTAPTRKSDAIAAKYAARAVDA